MTNLTSPIATDAPDVAAALDLLLADAAIGIARRVRPVRALGRVVRELLAHPRLATSEALALTRQLDHIVRGRTTVTADPRDRRFADPAWTSNPVLRRAVQTYLAAADTAGRVVESLDLDPVEHERVRFVMGNLVDAAAPSNNPFLNPTALKAAIDSGGTSTLRGLRAFVDDMSSTPRIPRMVEPDAFEVGRDLALTPGAVVHRDDLYELIQFAPQTARVHTTPVLIVPPTINKYYVLDLAPGRSLIEHLVQQGLQVFTISWRNPDARYRECGLDAYGTAVVDALDAVRQISRAATANMIGVCSGGIIASMALAHLSAIGDARVDAFTLLVTVLDQERRGLTGALVDDNIADMAIRASARTGYLDGNSLAEVFAWLRPNDLIWNYWVNNYLLGRTPPPFDILYWNADTTRMPAALHRDFLRLATTNALVTPDTTTMLDTPVDLGTITADAYVVAGVADHICPWQSCFRSTQLLGGTTRFVLSTNGHIAALVNPPGNPKSSYRVVDRPGPDADAWADSAPVQGGSWWDDHAAWLLARSGPTKRAPRKLGGVGHPAREQAPGTYVFDH